MKARKISISAEDIAKAYSNLRMHDSDVGSAQVQVTKLTEKILHLTQHMIIHRNDKHSRRGLVNMVSKRRKLLRYLKRTDASTHTTTLSSLGLRK